MKTFYLPIFLAIGGGALYHVAQKSIPKDANPMLALSIAYLTSIAAVLLCSVFLPANEPFVAELKKTNWAMFAVGIGAAAIEIGFLFAYRAGWNISAANLFVNIAIALIVIPIGLAFFSEHLTLRNLAGIALCILGLVLLSKK
jgi:drug/metabolite transporter (DMT)-like permease